MTPATFREANKFLAPPMDHQTNLEVGEIIGLPVHVCETRCISLWRMSWAERLSALLFGKVWLHVLTVRGTQPPVYLQAKAELWHDDDTDQNGMWLGAFIVLLCILCTIGIMAYVLWKQLTT